LCLRKVFGFLLNIKCSENLFFHFLFPINNFSHRVLFFRIKMEFFRNNLLIRFCSIVIIFECGFQNRKCWILRLFLQNNNIVSTLSKFNIFQRNFEFLRRLRNFMRAQSTSIQSFNFYLRLNSNSTHQITKSINKNGTNKSRTRNKRIVSVSYFSQFFK
jgi:hypothetical protein